MLTEVCIILVKDGILYICIVVYKMLFRNIRPLTVSREQQPEVDSDRNPVLIQDGFSVTPQADVHGAGTRF